MTYYDRNLAALDEIEDLLEAYGDARLTPSGPVLARIRRKVMDEAAAFVAASAAASERLPVADTSTAARWSLAGRSLPRLRVAPRVFALGFAAALTVGTSAAVMAAPPGSAFYNARVVIEAIVLPGNPDALLAVHEDHLAQRIADARAAASRGDAVGLAAALAAYQAEVDASLADLGDDAARLAHLEHVLGTHVAVLTALEADVPEQAAVDRALEDSQQAIEVIKEKGSAGARPENPGGRPDKAPSRVPDRD